VVQFLSNPTNGSTAQDFFYFFPPARLPEYIIGALACQIMLNGFKIRFRFVWLVFPVATLLPLWIYCHLVPPLNRELTIQSLVVIPGFLITIFVAACRDMHPKKSLFPSLLRTRQMVWLGDVSYSYYMIHVLVLGALGLTLAHFGVVTTSVWIGSLWLVGFLGLTLLIAWGIWRLIEHPGQRLLLRLLRPRGKPSMKGRLDPGLATGGGADPAHEAQ
jgi:peptidoglycan/LPS O-acetylase OafA/YrhL